MSNSRKTPQGTIDVRQLSLTQLKELADSQVRHLAATDLRQPPFSGLTELEQWSTLLDTFLQLRGSESSQSSAQLASALLMLMKREEVTT